MPPFPKPVDDSTLEIIVLSIRLQSQPSIINPISSMVIVPNNLLHDGFRNLSLSALFPFRLLSHMLPLENGVKFFPWKN